MTPIMRTQVQGLDAALDRPVILQAHHFASVGLGMFSQTWPRRSQGDRRGFHISCQWWVGGKYVAEDWSYGPPGHANGAGTL